MVSAMMARHRSDTSRTKSSPRIPAFCNGAVSAFHAATKAGAPAKAIQNSSTRIGTPRMIST